jgi:hypothetical protein
LDFESRKGHRMSRGEIRRRLDRLESEGPSPDDEERIKAAIRERIMMAYLDEKASLMAPGFRRAKKAEDRRLEPEAVRLWGRAYTEGQLAEEALRRVFAKLEEVLRKPSGNTGDLLQYVTPEELTPEAKERMCQLWIEGKKLRIEEQGGSWDEVNRFERERREKEGEG